MDVMDWQRFPDGPVFHYTSQKGLLGIINTKSLWATNILYMNDAAELQYAVGLARGQIALLKESLSSEDVRLLDAIDRELDRITRMRSDGIYVCSFSSHGDQLSQWRGYCPGGNGFSIGIDLPRVQEAIATQRFRPEKCIYAPNRQVELIKKFLLESLTNLRKFSTAHATDESGLETALAIIALNFLEIAPIIKHEKFSEEDEWRLISRPVSANDPRLRFREGKSTIIPYLEFKLANADEPISIEKLYIGPTPYKELAYMATLQLLSANGIEKCSTMLSEVPYRNW